MKSTNDGRWNHTILNFTYAHMDKCTHTHTCMKPYKKQSADRTENVVVQADCPMGLCPTICEVSHL